MSGSGYTIPAEFDFGNSAQRAQELQAVFARLISQANQLSTAFDQAGSKGAASGDKAAQGLLKQLRDALTVLETTARAVQTVSAEVRTLNAQGTGARNLARANTEADVQAVSRRGRVGQQITRADSVEDLRPIEVALRRDVERLKASRRELTRIVDGAQEGDAEDAKKRLAQTARQVRTARDALAKLEERRTELLQVESATRARQREVDNIRRRTTFNQDPEIQALREAERASRPVRPGLSFEQRVAASIDRTAVNQEAQARLPEGTRQRILENLRASQIARQGVRLDLESDPAFAAGGDALALAGRFRRLRVDNLAEANPDFVAAREAVARQSRITSLQRQIAQAKDSEIQGLRDQLKALQGTPTGPTLAGTVQRLVLGSQALAQAATDPATRGYLLQGNLARMDLSTAAQEARYNDPAERARLTALRVEGARIAADANLRILESQADRARLVQLGVARGALSDDVATARLADPAAQDAAIRRRQAQARVNLAADESMPADLQARRADVARGQAREFMFGDGGERLFETQARLVAQYAVLNQITNAFTSLTTAVVDYDRALRNLQAISGSTDGEMRKLSTTIVDVSRGTRFTAVELAEVSTTLSQAGLSIREVNQTLGSVALLATASGSSLATAADVFTSALGVFRLRAQESTSVANQMVAALNLSKLTMDQLALGIQYASNVAADSNISFTELTAALATMANAGIRSGSTLGTGLRQLIIDLETPSEKLTERLRSLGLTTDDVNVRTRGLGGALQTLREAGFSTVDALATLEVRSSTAFAALSRGLDDMRNLEDQIRSFTGAAEANETQMRALGNAAIAFSNNLKAIAFEATANTVAALASLMKGLADVSRGAADSSATIRVVGDALIGIGTIIAAGWVLRVTGALTAVTTATAAMSAAMVAARTSAIGLTVVGGIAGPATAAAAAVSGLAVAARSLVFSLPGLAAIGGITYALYNLADGSRSAANAQNDLREKVNQTKGAVDEAKRNYEAVSEQIVRLNARQRDLGDGSDALTSAVNEMRDRFRDLDTTVFGNINTFDGLVGALNRLRTGINQGLIGDLIKLRDTLRESVGSEEAKVLGELAGARRTVGQLDVQTRDPRILAARQNETITAARELLGRPGAPTLEDTRTALQNLRRTADENPNTLIAATAQELIRRFSTIEQSLQRIAVNRGEITSTDGRIRLAEISATPGFQAAQQAAERARGTVERRRQVADLSPEELAGGGRVAELRGELERAIADVQGYLTSLPEDQRSAASGALRVADLQSLLRDFNKSVSDRVSGRAVAIAEIETRNVQREVERLLQEASRGNTSAERRTEIRRELEGEGGLLARLRDNRITAFRESGPFRERSRTDPDIAGRQLLSAEQDAQREVEAFQARFNQAVGAQRVREIDAALAAARARVREATSRTARTGPAGPRAEARTALEAANAEIERLEREKAELVASGTAGARGDAAGTSGQAALNRFDRPGEYSTRTDPRFADSDNYGGAIRNIEEGIRNERFEAETEPRRIRAELDAARRVPERFSRGSLIQLERDLNEAEIESERSVANSQRRRIEELTRLEAQIRPRLDALRDALKARPDAEAPVTEESRELSQRIQTLQNAVGQINTLRQNATLTIAQTEAIARARASESSGSMVDALRDARVVFEREFSMGDSVFKQFSDSMIQVFGDAQRATADFFMAFATGSKSTKEAARDLAVGILQSMARIATNKLAAQLLTMGIDFAIGAFGGGVQTGSQPGGGTPDYAGMITKYNGGPASPFMRFASGGRVPGTNIGRDTVRALVAPDEYVVSARGHRLVGTETLDAINRGQLAAVRQAPAQAMRRDPDQVSVYVMAPNEKPTLGPNDVLAVIGQDVLTGGSTKQLIRQVAVGAI